MCRESQHNKSAQTDANSAGAAGFNRYKHQAMNRLIVLLICTLFLLGCSDKGWKYEDQAEHEAFIEELKIQNIPFDLGSDGYVYYSSKDEEKIQKIREELSNRFGPPYSVITIKQNEKEMAEKDFEKLGIEYYIARFESGYMVRWAREDNTKVMKMLKGADYYYDPQK